MSEGPRSREPSSNTQEFEAVRAEEGVDIRTEFEMVGFYRLPIKVDFKHPVELRLGRDGQTPSCYLVRNPTHFAHESAFAVVQPEVVRRSPGRGWANVGDGVRQTLLKIGRDVSPQFDLGPDVSQRHCLISIERARDSGLIEVETHGRNGTRVIVHPGDIGGEIGPIDPEDNPF